ncbi:tyrosine-type recombinase/integrase [Glycomyces buryatensis]|uniref:Site-specific integrase n=1 Tax=Glycomyces buryatensis TaxID=2570927 RepID=A0A4S8QSF2_9ACTN|nr:tyrosine-type recombinase/integrase [Glycomyces buryatensis]THV43564.1 site-specific integrase [Glycomyces buryatensis]
MARTWIEDRTKHAVYRKQVAEAKAAGRIPPGRWRLRWYDPSGKAKALTFKKKSQAEVEQVQLEARLDEGTYRDPKAEKMSFGDAAAKWFENRRDIKDSSRKSYSAAMEKHLIPAWGLTPLDALTFERITDWLSEIHDPDADQPDEDNDGKRPRAKEGKVGASHLRTVHRVLSMVLDWAVMTKRLAANPAVGVPLPRRPPSAHIYLSHAEVDQLADTVLSLNYRLTASRQKAPEYRVLLLLLAYTGLRWGEVSALRTGRVDLERRRIHVVEAYSEPKGGKLYLSTPKSHESRSVPIPEFLVAELAPLLPQAGTEADRLVFTSPNGGVMRAANFRTRVFDRAVGEAKLSGAMTIHKLRHTAASPAIAAGADIKVVQQMLGHASATMTLDVYGHLFPDRLDEVADAMSAKRAAALGLEDENA